MSQADLTLEVTPTEHPGRALVRMPMDRMSQLGLHPGDCVALHVGRTTHARVMPSAQGDVGVETSAETAQNMRGSFGSAATAQFANLQVLHSALIKVQGSNDVRSDDLAEALFDLPLTEGDVLSVTLTMGREVVVEVVTLHHAPAGVFGAQTLLTITAAPPPSAGHNSIGGMEREIAQVHEMVAVPLLRPELFERLGVPAPRGVLFTGPPGSGKTLLARAVAAQTSAAFFQINGPEIVSKHYGESEAALRAVFDTAAKDTPAIIFIDEIDAIAPRRDTLSGEKQVERRVVAQLLTLMDGLSERGRVIVMAATNLPDSLDPALRRPGRFDREIGFGPPDAPQREAILRVHLREAPLAPDVALAEVAAETQGYVGADLAAVAREGSLAALDRVVTQAGGEQRVDPENLFITQTDLLRGVAATSPSVLRDTTVESPRVTFDDVGGMEGVKDALTEAVLWPLEHRAAYAELGLSPAAGILMTGPPGSGKTLLARAMAAQGGMNFIPVRPARILSQFLGDAERAIAEIFSKARQAAPCLIFFDELDALAPRRGRGDATQDRLVAQLLTEMDGLVRNANVVVLAATNRAASIDPALTRAGRFDVIIQIPLPDFATRRAILQVHCTPLPLNPDLDLEVWAARAEGMSGADLAALVGAAARHALRRKLSEKQDTPTVEGEDFKHAFEGMAQAQKARREDFITEGAQA